jgi:hypothetical protein
MEVVLRPTVSRPVCLGVKHPPGAYDQIFYCCQTVAGLLMWGALSAERTGLPFTIAAGFRPRSHSWIRVPRDLWPHSTVSDSRLPQPGEPGPCFYIPQEQGGPVVPPGTGFPFRRLLRLAGLRCRYSNPPPRGVVLYSFRTDHAQKTQFYCCVAPTAQKTAHEVPTQRVHWRVDCCLATSYKHSSYWDTAAIVARFSLFTEPLPSNALAINVTIWFFTDMIRGIQYSI